MKIAFDGTVLHEPKSGVGYYCEELLKAMLAIAGEHRFFVFSHLPVQLDFPARKENLSYTNSVQFPVRAVYLHAFLPRILDKVQPDVCHYTNFLAPVSEERPYVVTIHDMGLETLGSAHPLAKRVYTRRLVPHVARKAKLIITNSEYSKWEIVKYLGICEDRIRVTPLAASAEFRPVPIPARAPYFLYVGNLEPRKNLDRLIEAFARIPKKDHELLIVGNRWYQGSRAEQKARSLGLNGRVKFLGYVPRSDLPTIFSGATGFVYPSLLEGFGLPIVEAMACGTPVITSNSSSMKEVAGQAALLINPTDVREMTDAMARLADDAILRRELSKQGLKRAAEFSWEKTAQLTLAAYQEVAGGAPRHAATCAAKDEGRKAVDAAIRKTIEYAELFQYPLTIEELHERLFDIKVDEETFRRQLQSMEIEPSADLVRLRAEREQISDRVIQEVRPHLRTLASLPFVRMIAFSGSTAHRNMTTAEDVDLFLIIEDGKLWAFFLTAMVWAKLKGLRKRLCMNYVISDAALPLAEHDVFTAQQAASLKPVFGRTVYDRFIAMNPFIRRRFPNFDPARHRNSFAEISAAPFKRPLELFLRFGAVQILERFSRLILRSHFLRKTENESDVQLDSRRLKLHLRSHKRPILNRFQ